MYRKMIFSISLVLVLAIAGLGNPIPWPPPASMPLEDMHIEIKPSGDGLHAVFTGDYTFTYIPKDVESMLFPVPPDANNIRVWQDGVELTWTWSSEKYPTILPEIPTIPMIEWQGPFPESGAVFTVDYEHDLIKRPAEFIFFYALGTGKYFPTYEKTTTAYFDILLPAGFKVAGVWLDETPHEYEVVNGHLKVTVESYFGPIVNDLIVSLVPEKAAYLENVKWSQPPIEINPASKTPVFCGWDEPSFISIPEFRFRGVADDFRCLGNMPVASVHWWGSYLNWESPEPPLEQPAGWWIGFWSNVPASGNPPFSRPGTLLWYVRVPAERVHRQFAGFDRFPQRPSDACFQYNVKLKPDEYFWQGRYASAQRDIYWISIIADYPGRIPEHVWGWKTRPRHWMDDAVTLDFHEGPQPGTEVDYRRITPIKDPLTGKSFDVAFELDTNPHWVKWEQHFTGIRDWPHYEDELSMEKTNATGQPNTLRLVADDWECERETPVTAAVWWGSYIGYRYQACQDVQMIPPVKPDYFLLRMWNDVPAETDAEVPFSHPNDIIWEYRAYDYDEVLVGYDKHPENALGPAEPVFRYSVRLPEKHWFRQKDVKGIYWFSVVAVYNTSKPNYEWGWTNHKHEFNDDAVAGYPDPSGLTPRWKWQELHDQTGKSEDMSFMLFTQPWPECWNYLTQCHGDTDNTGNVSGRDFLAVKRSWYRCYPDPGYNPCADFDRDGCVKGSDFLILKSNWYRRLPADCPLGGEWPPQP